MKAKLGQNFLVNEAAPAAIVAAAGELGEATVLEIGPGKGAITALLASASRRLIAVELDRELASQLTAKYASASGSVKIISADILRIDLSELAEREATKLIIVGNLPYYITSAILLHLYAHEKALDRAVLMMQREVADRICASPGTRDYGLLTVTTQLYAVAERLFDLAPADFDPPPEVYSSVVRFQFRSRADGLGVDTAQFVPFLRHCFALKRKTLTNNLRAAGFTSAQVREAYRSCEVIGEPRAEATSLLQLVALFQVLTGLGPR